MMLTDPPSTSHRPTHSGSMPGCFVTSSVKCTCGFCHFHSRTTPRYSTSLSIWNIAKEWCAASDTEARAKSTTARPTRPILIRTSAITATRASLYDLFGRDDRLFLYRIARVAPLFERIADLRSAGAHRWRALEIIAVHMGLLVDLGVAPRVRNREPPAVRGDLEALDEHCLRGADAAPRHPTGSEPGRLDDQRVPLIPTDGVPGRRRRPGTRVRPSVQVEMPHATALACEDHLIFLLDEVHASRIRINQKRTVAAAAAPSPAWLRDDDVRDAFRVGRGLLRFQPPAAAAPSTAAAPAAGGHAWQQLRGRDRCPKPIEAPRAVGV